MANLGFNSEKGEEGRVNPAFWRNKKVLLTGHTGFKGSWLSLWLESMGASVYGFSKTPDTDPSMFTVLGLEKHCDHVIGDIRDLSALKKRIAMVTPDVVCHFAAQPIVKDGYANPIYTFETNVIGTANLLEACRGSHSIRSIVIVTSDKCYRPATTQKPHVEGDVLGGIDPYSASKSCAELVTDSYRASFFAVEADGPTVMSARAGNVYGGGDWGNDRLVVDAMRAFATNKALTLRQPDAVRPWQHVLDPLAGYLLLAERGYESPTYGTSWNFGPDVGTAKTVHQVANALAKAWQGGVVTIDKTQASFKETKLLQLDSGKARAHLGWSPLFSLDEGIELTVEWYKAFYAGASSADMLALTLQQIARTRRATHVHGKAS